MFPVMKIYLSLAIIIFLVCAGCKKHNDNNNNSNNPVNNSSNKLLRSFKEVSGTDSIRFYFNYNSQNRISTTQAYDYENSILLGEVTYTFNYNGSDTVFSNVRMDYTDHTSGGSNETDTEYFIMGSSGTLQKDSITTATGYMKYSFDYFTDYFQVSTNFGDTVITEQTIVNGNIVAEHDTIYGPFIMDYSVNGNISFDSHPNPFYYTGIRRVLLHMPENYLQDIEAQTPVFKNNPIEIRSISTGSPASNTHYQYSYTYDADGYPSAVTINDVVNAVVASGYYYY
jgi:hypothetical protein